MLSGYWSWLGPSEFLENTTNVEECKVPVEEEPGIGIGLPFGSIYATVRLDDIITRTMTEEYILLCSGPIKIFRLNHTL
jgi:hypothetical protein